MLNWWRKKQKQPSTDASESAAQPAQVAPSSQTEIEQNVPNNQGQVIGQITGGTAIGTQTINNILPTPTPSLSGIPSNLQERGSRTFVGRDETLENLHAKLQTSQTLAITAL